MRRTLLSKGLQHLLGECHTSPRVQSFRPCKGLSVNRLKAAIWVWVQSYLLVLLALGAVAFPARGEFRKIPVSTITNCSVPLFRVQTISYRCIRWVDYTIQWSFWQSALGFDFGQLSYQDWQTLTQIYTGWHNPQLLLPYDPQHHYVLLDFMPPMLQALDRHRFYAQKRTLAIGPSSMEIQLVANCWGTLYETLRLADQPQVESPVLFATAAQPMLDMLRTQSVPVTGPEQPGDLVLISHRHGKHTYLDHAVLAIDRGLFFEKAGTGDEVPYRFTDEATLQRIWNPAIFNYVRRRRRPHQRLPEPRNYFSLQYTPQWLPLLIPDWLKSQLAIIAEPTSPPIFLQIQPLPPLRLVQGRFQLPEAAYHPDSLWPRENPAILPSIAP